MVVYTRFFLCSCVCSGKSGMVASRFAGSLSSLGIPAHYVHAGEWVHGDLGECALHTPVVYSWDIKAACIR